MTFIRQFDPILCAQCGASVPYQTGRRFCGRPCYSAWRSTHIRGVNHPNYKGRIAAQYGYIRVWAPGHPLADSIGYVPEHRMVVFDAGIEIPKGYTVHHINHDKTDNRLENLAVMHPSDHHHLHIAEAGVIVNQFGTWNLNPIPWAQRNPERVKEYKRRYKARQKERNKCA